MNAALLYSNPYNYCYIHQHKDNTVTIIMSSLQSQSRDSINVQRFIRRLELQVNQPEGISSSSNSGSGEIDYSYYNSLATLTVSHKFHLSGLRDRLTMEMSMCRISDMLGA